MRPLLGRLSVDIMSLSLHVAETFPDRAVSDLAYGQHPIPMLPSHFNYIAEERSSPCGKHDG